jgi:tryptophan-rich sensory protein
MIYHCFIVDKIAGIVIMPYILWVTIASALNFSLLRRNPNKI